MTHSPTPWRTDGEELRGPDDHFIGNTGREDDKLGIMKEDDLANAAHIVKCVNNHDALVAALTAMKAAAIDVNELHLDKNTLSYQALRRALCQARYVFDLLEVEE
jgi:hypothetical protein